MHLSRAVAHPKLNYTVRTVPRIVAIGAIDWFDNQLKEVFNHTINRTPPMQSGGTEMRRSEWVAVRAKRCKRQTKQETEVFWDKDANAKRRFGVMAVKTVRTITRRTESRMTVSVSPHTDDPRCGLYDSMNE